MGAHTVYISAGSNMGDRKANLSQALSRCIEQLGVFISCSSVYETAAWGMRDQDDFYNIVFSVSTILEPQDTLRTLLSTEQEMGRVRDIKWGPRKIDLDILFFDRQIISEPGLTVPHPQLQNRRFILEPLCEIAPALQHPVSGITMQELLQQCPDPLKVHRTNIHLLS